MYSKKEKEFLYINKRKVDNPVENQAKDLNRYFTKEDTEMVINYTKGGLVFISYQ